MAGSETASEPVLVLTGSRSGSTLLRFILDTHPDLVCPPETGVGSLCASIARAVAVLEGSAMNGTPGEEILTPAAEALIRTSVARIFADYTARSGTSRWCDKSLDNVLHADLLAQVWPEGRFICLVRHCMDMVASAVEACQWGLTGFGLDPFASHYPGNSVAAIGAYWVQTTTSLLEFAEKYSDRCLVVRYEDLVAQPDQVSAQIFGFLHVRQVPGIAEACLQMPHSTTGPSDEKIWFTRKIHQDSVGRGITVPIAGLPPMMRDAINGLSERLGYRPITADWNTSFETMDPRVDDEGQAMRSAAQAGPAAAEDVRLISAVESLVADRIAARNGHITKLVTRWPRLSGRTIGITVYTSSGEKKAFRWRLPFMAAGVPQESISAAGEAPQLTANGNANGGQEASHLLGDAHVWLQVLNGSTNVAVELISGGLRMVGPALPGRLCSDEAHALSELLGLAYGRPEVPAEPGHPVPHTG